MVHIDTIQLTTYKHRLTAALDKLRDDVSEILMRSNHAGHKMAAEQFKKSSNDELVELALKFNIPSIAHKITKIKNIDASINDIELGLYGICSDCEDDIEITRLEFDPTSKRCEDCEKKYQKQKYNEFKL